MPDFSPKLPFNSSISLGAVKIKLWDFYRLLQSDVNVVSGEAWIKIDFVLRRFYSV